MGVAGRTDEGVSKGASAVFFVAFVVVRSFLFLELLADSQHFGLPIRVEVEGW